MYARENDSLSKIERRYGVPVVLDEEIDDWIVDRDLTAKPVQIRFHPDAYDSMVQHLLQSSANL